MQQLPAVADFPVVTLKAFVGHIVGLRAEIAQDNVAGVSAFTKFLKRPGKGKEAKSKRLAEETSFWAAAMAVLSPSLQKKAGPLWAALPTESLLQGLDAPLKHLTQEACNSLGKCSLSSNHVAPVFHSLLDVSIKKWVELLKTCMKS